MARVANALDEASLGTSFQIANESNGWQYFVVSFTPSHASRSRVESVITDAGGKVLDRPPLAATSGPRTVIWAKVSNCICAGDPYKHIAGDLAAAHLDVDLALGPANADWLTFSATMDPTAVKSTYVMTILQKDGATILDRPPQGNP